MARSARNNSTIPGYKYKHAGVVHICAGCMTTKAPSKEAGSPVVIVAGPAYMHTKPLIIYTICGAEMQGLCSPRIAQSAQSICSVCHCYILRHKDMSLPPVETLPLCSPGASVLRAAAVAQSPLELPGLPCAQHSHHDNEEQGCVRTRPMLL